MADVQTVPNLRLAFKKGLVVALFMEGGVAAVQNDAISEQSKNLATRLYLDSKLYAHFMRSHSLELNSGRHLIKIHEG